jgi:hypothetical protein
VAQLYQLRLQREVLYHGEYVLVCAIVLPFDPHDHTQTWPSRERCDDGGADPDLGP